MVQTNSFSRANEHNSGRRSAKKQPQEVDQFDLKSSSRASTPAPTATSGEPGEEAPAGREAVGAMARNHLALYFDNIQMASAACPARPPSYLDFAARPPDT